MIPIYREFACLSIDLEAVLVDRAVREEGLDQQDVSELQVQHGAILLGALRAEPGRDSLYLLLKEETDEINMM